MTFENSCPLGHSQPFILTAQSWCDRTDRLTVDCLGDFSPRGLSVQYTQDVRGCRPAHTGPHTGRPWLSISTHISTLVLGLSTLTLPVDCSGDFGPRGQSVQYTQDVRGCPTAHTGRLWLSVCFRVCLSAHTGRLWLSISTHISTLVLGLSTLTVPVDCSGDFGPRGLSVQYTQDVRGCLSAHTGRPCVSVRTKRTFVAVRVCPCVSVSTQRTSIVVHQYTYQHAGPWTQHADPFRGLFGLVIGLFPHRTSVGVRQHTQGVRGCPWLSVCVCVCPSAHTGHPWVSISTHISTLVLGLSTLALPMDYSGDFGPCGLFVQYTQDVGGCPSAHTEPHTERPWLSISTHISTLVLGLSTLTLPVDCSGDFGPRGLSVQYTQDVRGCPSAHTGHPCVSVRTHRKSVAVRVCPSAHTGRLWLSISTHISTLVLGLSTLTLPVDCSGDFGPRGLSVQYTQDVCGCPPAHTGRLWLSVCVCVCLSAHTRRLWLSISTHISTLVLGLSTLTLPVDCSGDFGPRGLSVQYTQDVHGCPSAHTGRLCVFVRTHMTTLNLPVDCSGDFGPRGLSVQYTQVVHGCPSAHTGPHRGRPFLSISTHISTLVLGLSTLTLPVDCLGDFGPRGLSVQYTQDIRGCPPAHTGSSWLSVCVRQCSSACTGQSWLSISTHISTLVLGLSTLALPWTVWVILAHMGCLFSTHRTSVGVRQHTHDVCGCPSAHTGRPWLSVCVCVCPSAHTGRLWVSVSTHRTSVCVRQHTQDVRGCPWLSVCVRVCPSAHTGRPWLSISTHISTLVLGLSTRALPVDCLGDFGPRGLTSVAVHQYTYQHAGPWTQHAGPSRGLFGIVGTAMVRGNVPASLRISRQAFHGRERSSTSSTKLGLVHSSSVPTKSALLAGILAQSAEADESQLIAARRTVRVLGRWSGSGKGDGMQVAERAQPLADGDHSLASRACLVKYSEKNVERERVPVKRKAEFRVVRFPATLIVCEATSGQEWEIKTSRRAWRTQTWFTRINGWEMNEDGTGLAGCVSLSRSINGWRWDDGRHKALQGRVARSDRLLRPSGLDLRLTRPIGSRRRPDQVRKSVGPLSRTSLAATDVLWVLTDTHGHTRTATDVLCVLTDTHGLPVCADGHPLSCPRSWIGSSGRTAVQGNAPVRSHDLRTSVSWS
ncbi:hypothetical protein IGI04_042390 [Brassica rapa subsp. trilocularis]|uniref:Uncharacterized protein n=1 Tax=Brassica rapa subsp. trilocularis TaxID=1813537 RepID=A0ABQ7KL94_BRACM|nr:hypothetical protein IGI04_042390 [Brassica rapa subsp. trilocularis]